jgi:prefoldin subunit 5
MTGNTRPREHRRRDRLLGGAGQVAGVVGLVLCVMLAVGALLSRSWALDTVDSLAQRVDQGIGKALPPVTRAATMVGDVSGRIGDVADAADVVAALPAPQSERLQALQARLQALSDRYLELRTAYADVREQIASVIARVQSIDALLPGVSLPEGPVDRLAELDTRIQQVDAAIMEVIGADLVGSTVNETASRIADRARQAEANLDGVADRLAGVASQLTALQADLDNIASTSKTGITLGTIAGMALLVYFALLHWILFRVSRRLWLASGGAAAAPDAPSASDGPVSRIPPQDDSPTEPLPKPA